MTKRQAKPIAEEIKSYVQGRLKGMKLADQYEVLMQLHALIGGLHSDLEDELADQSYERQAKRKAAAAPPR